MRGEREYLAKSSPGKRQRIVSKISLGTRSLLRKWVSCSEVMGVVVDSSRFPFLCGECGMVCGAGRSTSTKM
jgi:hypothetical protein